MFKRLLLAVLAGVVGLGVWLGSAAPARAQYPEQLNRFYYYPYYYFPWNYWPDCGPRWPERSSG